MPKTTDILVVFTVLALLAGSPGLLPADPLTLAFDQGPATPLLHLSENPSRPEKSPFLFGHVKKPTHTDVFGHNPEFRFYSGPNNSDRSLDKAEEDRRREVVEDYLRDSAAHLLEQTLLGRKATQYKHRFSKYFRMDFTKKAREESAQWLFPGQESADEDTPSETEYGMAFSTRFHLNTDDIIEDILFEVRATYFENRLNLSYEIMENQFKLQYFNTGVNRFLGGDIQWEVIGDSDEISNAILIRKSF